MRPGERPYLSIQSSGVCDEGEGVCPVVDRYVLLYSIVDLLVDVMRLVGGWMVISSTLF